MSTLADDLQRLADLHQRGALNDDEFRRAKARLIDTPAAGPGGGSPFNSAQAAVNSFRRSPSDRWIGGVCGGIARSTGVAAWVWRLLFVLALTCAGSGLVIYGLAWLLVPLDEAAVPPALPGHGHHPA